MHDLFIQEALAALLQVIMIDLTLAGDNAIVIGLAAAGLPRAQRNKAILVGIVAATVLRIIFAGLTIQLLQIVGLLFAGGMPTGAARGRHRRQVSHPNRYYPSAAGRTKGPQARNAVTTSTLFAWTRSSNDPCRRMLLMLNA